VAVLITAVSSPAYAEPEHEKYCVIHDRRAPDGCALWGYRVVDGDEGSDSTPQWREPTLADLNDALTPAERSEYGPRLAPMAGSTCVGIGEDSLQWSGTAYVRLRNSRLCSVLLMTPAEAAHQVIAELRLATPQVGFGPSPDINPWGVAVVGYPYWLWGDGGNQQPQHSAASAGGISVSLDVRVSAITWNMGDGSAPFTCTSGRAWTRADNMKPSPDCGYTYQHRSVPGQYTITATTRWTITWHAGGQTGSEDLYGTSAKTLTVDELQTVRH